MYFPAVYDGIAALPCYSAGVVLRGTLEQVQWWKVDTLLDRAQVKPGQAVLDTKFGWGGLSRSGCPSSCKCCSCSTS